jgi:SAM-dependent methyltransferase
MDALEAPVIAGPAGLLVCPACRRPLAWERQLTCPDCGQRYLANGVPCFRDRGAYFDSLPPKPDMQQILEISRARGYREALTGYLAARFPRLMSRTPLAPPGRMRGIEVLCGAGEERVLDFGCALGVLSVPLTKRVKEVVALDATHEALEFLTLVKAQDGLDNLVPVCNGDPLHLPFADQYFDWTVLNAVFEYLPESIDEPDVRQAHLLALQEFRRVLKPGGRLYLATKNRFSHQNLLGSQDHNGLRFTALLPRALANFVSVKARRGPYRTITYSFREYRRLLDEAGFESTRFYWPVPDLWSPDHLVPLTETRAAMLTALAPIGWSSPAKRAFWHLAASLGLLPALAPTYIIVAAR